MAANTDDGALLLVKKFGGIVLILLGILGIAVGLEYRSTGLLNRSRRSGWACACLWHGAPSAEDRPA